MSKKQKIQKLLWNHIVMKYCDIAKYSFANILISINSNLALFLKLKNH